MFGTEGLFAWSVFIVAVVAMLVLDFVVHRGDRALSTKSSAVWSGVWIAVSLVFSGYVYVAFGADAWHTFLAGYVIEKALSVDNLLVFYVLFSAFRVPRRDQERVLFWGVLGAVVLRSAMIFGGVWLLERFGWLMFPFAFVLGWTGVSMLVQKDELPNPEETRLFRFVKKRVPATDGLRGHHFFVREEGRLLATPLFVVLLLVEGSDILFAFDSLLAVFAITTDPFLVFTSNVFALLGMRALYSVLASLTARFDYLQPGLAVVLIFVALKMALGHWVEVPVVWSLVVVVVLLGGSFVGSLIKEKRQQKAKSEGGGG